MDDIRPARLCKVYLLTGLAVFLAHLLVTAGHLMSPDDELLFRTAESIATRGSLDIRPLEWDEKTDRLLVPPEQTFATVPSRPGGFQAQYLPLQAALASPLVWLADLTAPLFAEKFATLQRGTVMHPRLEARAAWRRAAAGLFNPLVMAATAMLLLRMGRFLAGGCVRAGLWTAFLWAFGTMAWPHSRTFFTEPLAGFFGLLALDALLRWFSEPRDRRLRHTLVIGGSLAAANWTRMDSPAIAAGIGLTMLAAGIWKGRRVAMYFPARDLTLAGAVTAGSYALLLAFNHWRFARGAGTIGGGYSDQSEGVQFTTPLLVGLHGYLMSPGKGMFFFSPALAAAVWGWGRLPRGMRWAGLMTFGAMAPFAFAMVKWQNWDGGWCWGPRHVFQLHAPLMLGTAFVAGGTLTLTRRAALQTILIAGIGVQLYGSLQSPLDFYHDLYRSTDDGFYYRAAYRPTEETLISNRFRIMAPDPARGTGLFPANPSALPAPMVDSLYLPGHTQWEGHAAMWGRGECDLLLVRWLLPPRDVASEAESKVSTHDPPD